MRVYSTVLLGQLNWKLVYINMQFITPWTGWRSWIQRMKDFRPTVQLIQTTRRKHGNGFGFLKTKS